MPAATLVVMFSKDSSNFVCELCLMLSGIMFEMVSLIMLYGLVTSILLVSASNEYILESNISKVLCSGDSIGITSLTYMV